MRGPSGARLGLAPICMDDFGVSLVTKRSHLTPEWTTGVVLLKVPEPAPPDARQMRESSWCLPGLHRRAARPRGMKYSSPARRGISFPSMSKVYWPCTTIMYSS